MLFLGLRSAISRALKEKKISGEKIGEVFVRLGILKEMQLTALVDFQKNQNAAISGNNYSCKQPNLLGQCSDEKVRDFKG